MEQTSSKKVRITLEEKLGCDLTARKKEIDAMVMDYVNSQANNEESESESDNENLKTRAAATAKKTSKKRKADTSDDSGPDDDHKSKKSTSKSKKSRKSAGGGAKGKGTGFTRPYQLSPALAAIMGTESSPRHEVVKKVWSIIKERNLYDPKNKQFAICDSELFTVIGVKRFRTFGMLKYLKTHFIVD